MPRRNYNRKSPKTKTPHLAPTPDVACRQKRRFPTEKQARAAADTQELTNFALGLDVYHCQFCGGWHLTSRDKAN